MGEIRYSKKNESTRSGRVTRSASERLKGEVDERFEKERNA